jgi:PAS domain S-box-containing protein
MSKFNARHPVPPLDPIRLLLLEDSPADVELITAALAAAGYQLTFDIVDRPEEFRRRLREPDYDIILADYNLRTWTALDALEIRQELNLDIPLIVVTGSLGDEAAVEIVKQGAADYVLKNRLARLPMVLGRALREKAHREAAVRLEEQIRRAKKDWELTFDAVPDPILLLDAEHRIQRANRAAAALVGLTPAALVGKDCFEAICATGIAQEGCPLHPRPLSGEVGRGEIIGPQQGRIFDAIVAPIRDAQGNERGSVCILRDLTERKHAEETLRETNQMLRALIQTSPLAIISLDPAGRVKSWNEAAERMFGWQAEEVIGRPLPFAPAHDQDEAHAVLRRVLQGEVVHGVAMRRHRKDGTPVEVSVSAAPLYGAQGKVTGIEALLADITEHKSLEEQFRQAQKMEAVGRLAGGIAHDFNNLLTAINGYSELLLARLGEDTLDRHYVEEIKKAGDRAAALTSQLLAFSRRQVRAPRVLDLNSIVSNMDKMLRRVIGEDIVLATHLAQDLGRIKADPGQIEQVILNLAVNARDAMPQGGKLVIETANVDLSEEYAQRHVNVMPGAYVILSVTDTGCGMDAETKAHLFEPFYTTKEPGKGTGLGLATVYGIVKQSGGNVWVYSEVGEGTTFKIYFPRVEEMVSYQEPTRTSEELPRGTETVLLVEDEPTVRELVRRVLESSGYSVLEARHGEDAILVCEQHKGPIHLLLSDVIMPEMGGPELAEQLFPFHREMQVLFVSGYPDGAIIRRGIGDRPTAYLQKPFTAEALARKVREVLDAARLHNR